jgi:hypothetical protein
MASHRWEAECCSSRLDLLGAKAGPGVGGQGHRRQRQGHLRSHEQMVWSCQFRGCRVGAGALGEGIGLYRRGHLSLRDGDDKARRCVCLGGSSNAFVIVLGHFFFYRQLHRLQFPLGACSSMRCRISCWQARPGIRRFMERQRHPNLPRMRRNPLRAMQRILNTLSIRWSPGCSASGGGGG